jgi:hypothetical protein
VDELSFLSINICGLLAKILLMVELRLKMPNNKTTAITANMPLMLMLKLEDAACCSAASK